MTFIEVFLWNSIMVTNWSWIRLKTFLDDIYPVDSSLTNYPDEKRINILLYGSEYFSVKTNQ